MRDPGDCESFLTILIKLRLDAIIKRQSNHVHDVASQQSWVDTLEHASSTTFIFELVVRLTNCQWPLAQVRLLSSFYRILRDRDDPAQHTSSATCVECPQELLCGCLLLWAVLLVDQVIANLFQFLIAWEVHSPSWDVTPCHCPEASIDSSNSLSIDQLSNHMAISYLTLLLYLRSAFEKIERDKYEVADEAWDASCQQRRLWRWHVWSITCHVRLACVTCVKNYRVRGNCTYNWRRGTLVQTECAFIQNGFICALSCCDPSLLRLYSNLFEEWY